MLRSVLIVLLLLVPIAVAAAPTPSPAPSATDRGTHDGGLIEGRLTAVDYQKNTIGVDGGSRGRLTVNVMPSTSIQAKDAAYHTITDLRPGVRVQIFTSMSGDLLIAQIIRILP